MFYVTNKYSYMNHTQRIILSKNTFRSFLIPLVSGNLIYNEGNSFVIVVLGVIHSGANQLQIHVTNSLFLSSSLAPCPISLNYSHSQNLLPLVCFIEIHKTFLGDFKVLSHQATTFLFPRAYSNV